MRERLGTAAVGLIVVASLTGGLCAAERDRRGRVPASQRAAELRLPAKAPDGRWHNPVEGIRWEEGRRKVGVELSALPERGPLRCRLRVLPGTAAAGKPVLEVRVSNPTSSPVTVEGHTDAIDDVTFILRGPDDKVVSSFCYALVRSDIRAEEEPPPHYVVRPGEVLTAPIHLSVAADHGYRPLRPGRYTIEAVFQCAGGQARLGHEQGLVSRSERLPVLVGPR